MSATTAVRTKFYPKQVMINDSADEYYDMKAERDRAAAEARVRDCIIIGVHPHSGNSMSLTDHASALESISATEDEWDHYYVRCYEQRLKDLAENRALHDMIDSRYPCPSCDARLRDVSEQLQEASAALLAEIRE